jgi:hypothetical protein
MVLEARPIVVAVPARVDEMAHFGDAGVREGAALAGRGRPRGEAAVMVAVRMGEDHHIEDVVGAIGRKIILQLGGAVLVAAIDQDLEVAIFEERGVAIVIGLLNGERPANGRQPVSYKDNWLGQAMNSKRMNSRRYCSMRNWKRWSMSSNWSRRS